MTKTEVLLIAEARAMARSGRAAALRERAGLSRREVALGCDVDPSTISRWEALDHAPQGRAAVRWARFLRELAARERAAEEEAVACAQLEAMLAGRDPQAPQEKREAGFPASEPLADENVDGQRSTAP
jgi:transcriptional regulator with XRE-family HTH domain